MNVSPSFKNVLPRLHTLVKGFYWIYRKYIDLACKGTIAPGKLPLSRRAAFHHGLRAHYQIIECLKVLIFTTEGWRLTDSSLVPIMNDIEIAPKSLIKVLYIC